MRTKLLILLFACLFYIVTTYKDFIVCAYSMFISDSPQLSFSKINTLHEYARSIRYPRTANYRSDRSVTTAELDAFLNIWKQFSSTLKYTDGNFVCVQYSSIFRDLLRQYVPYADVYSIGGNGHCEVLINVDNKYYVIDPQGNMRLRVPTKRYENLVCD
jgi:hypothetical protein